MNFIKQVVIENLVARRPPLYIYIYNWVVVSNIFYVHPEIGEMIQFDEHIFQMGWEKTTNYIYFWSNYSDLTRPHPKWWFSKGNPLISGKSRLVKYYSIWPDI